MAELHEIAESLRRQKSDLQALREQTSTSSVETADLVAKTEELVRRAEETQTRLDRSADASEPETE